MNRRTVSVGLIGTGYWGKKLYERLIRHPRFTLTLVCDTDPSRAPDSMAEGCRFVTDVGAVAGDPRIDAVIVATPFVTHYSLARLLLSHGKHVLVEKPLAGSVRETDELIGLAADRHLTLMADYTYIYDPAIRWLRRAVRRKGFGRPVGAESVRLNTGIHRDDCNVIWDLGVHDLAISRFLFGLPHSVTVTGATTVRGQVDSCTVTLQYRDFSFVSTLAWNAMARRRDIRITGNGSRVSVDGIAATVACDPGDTGIVIPRRPFAETIPLMLADFARRVSTGTAGRNGLYRDVATLLDAADRSLLAGTAVAVA